MSEKKHLFNDDEINLRDIFITIKQNKWLIIGITAAIFLLAAIFVYRAPTIFESSALIQVENQSSIASSLQAPSSPDLNTIFGFSDRASASQVETALLQSRYILQPTIEVLSLNITILPRKMKLLGKFFYKPQEKLAKPFLWLSKYAWGGEKLAIRYFNMPDSLLNTTFILKAGPKNSYKLLTMDGELILKGKVGHVAKSPKHSNFPNIRIFVAKLVANSSTEFYVEKHSIYNMIGALASELTITDLGQNPEKSYGGTQTGILNVALSGTNPNKIPMVLNTIIALGSQKDVGKKSAEVNKTLRFLNRQVPVLKRDLDRAETKLSNYRMQNNAVDTDIEKNMLLQNLTEVGKNIEELKLKKQELLQNFTSRHPLVIAVKQQQKELHRELASLEAQVVKLPRAEQKILGLARDVKVKEQLYILLLNKIQELQVLSAGIMSNVRILDRATPAMPLPNKSSLMLLGSLFFGLILSLAIIFIRKALTTAVENPDKVEEHLNIPTFAVIPHSKAQEALTKDMKNNLLGAEFILEKLKPKDIAIEGLRSLRTAIYLKLQDAKNNVLAIVGASPGIGKSFVSANLAHIMANNGKKILLIDADLRKGKIHQYLGKKAYPGIADVLTGKASLDKSIKILKPDHLDFISCGVYPESPFDVLSSGKFKELLKHLSTQYDLIIIDTPPLLAVADALSITQHSAINLMVIGLGIENLSGIEHCVKRYTKNNVSVDGLIFNNAKQSGNYGSYGGYYYYNYEDKKQ